MHTSAYTGIYVYIKIYNIRVFTIYTYIRMHPSLLVTRSHSTTAVVINLDRPAPRGPLNEDHAHY